jgi:hypothetical protein
MSDGAYTYFLKKYFDVWKDEWKLDLDKADVKVMLLKPGYNPSWTRDKFVEQIKKHEIKKGMVKKKVPQEVKRDPLTYFSHWTTVDKTEEVEIEVPNGYDEGGKSIGPLGSYQRQQRCLNVFDEWEDWTVTTLYAKKEAVGWGMDDTLEEYPNKATLVVGSMVFYLNNGTDKNSVLITHCELGHKCENGSFNIVFNPRGIAKASILNGDKKTLFADRGIHWTQGRGCRKKKREYSPEAMEDIELVTSAEPIKY